MELPHLSKAQPSKVACVASPNPLLTRNAHGMSMECPRNAHGMPRSSGILIWWGAGAGEGKGLARSRKKAGATMMQSLPVPDWPIIQVRGTESLQRKHGIFAAATGILW